MEKNEEQKNNETISEKVPGDFSKIYERYRFEIDKEDKLIDDRVKWLLCSQTILFSFVAVGFTKVNIRGNVIEIISGLGLVLSLFIGVSIWAAIRALCEYKKKLEENSKSISNKEEYPQLNRSLTIINCGFFAPISLPLVFAAAWIFLIIYKKLNLLFR